MSCMTAGLQSIAKDRRFFKRLFLIIQISIGFYAVSFFMLEARLSALLYSSIVVVFAPLIALLEGRNFQNAARMGLMIEGLLAIYVTPFGVHAPLHAELYYIAALSLPLVVFDPRRRSLTLFAQLLCPLAWALQTWGPVPGLSSYWIPTSFPFQPFQILNAVGTSAILGIVLRLYTDSIFLYQSKLNAATERLEEAQRIAKLGGWEYRSATKRLSWSDELSAVVGLGATAQPTNLEQLNALIDPRDRGAWTEAVTQSLVDGRAFNLRFRSASSALELWIEARAHGLFDDQNRLCGLVGTFQDVSPQVKAETDLRRRQSLLEAILKSTPSMIFVKEYKKGLTFSLLNRAGEELLGVKEADILGMTMHDFLPSDQADACTALEHEAVASRKISVNEVEEFKLPSGTRKLRTYRVPTFDENGKPELLIGIFQDITAEVEAKADLEIERLKTIHVAKLASLGEMSAGMAHEINNPLTTLELVAGQLPRAVNDPAKIREKVEVIERSIRRIARIVGGLRRFSRSGPRPEPQLHSLREIVTEAVTLAEVRARGQGTTITLDTRTSGEVLCDEIGIEQVTINLINNAIDAVKDREKKWVKIDLYEDGEIIVLRVTDSGSGIAESIRRKIFDPFFTTKRSGEGTGLGLSICKGILADHDATIDIVIDHPNTCFELRFPRPAAIVDAA